MVAGVATLTVLCAASPAAAESVQWDANWNVTDAPTEIPDSNVISDIPGGFTFLSKNGSPYIDTANAETVVRLSGTAEGATNVNVIGGAGATSAATDVSEGPLTVDTWMKVTGGTYATLAGGSYAQNYSGGEPATFTGDSHILLTTENGGTAPSVDYIVGGNYMEAQDALFDGDSYISVESGTVNGSIVGGGTSAHNRTANFGGNSGIWIYTPLSGQAENRFSLPGHFIIGGNAAINNEAPVLSQTGESKVTIDLSAYTPAEGSAAGMDKTIVGGAWLLGNTTSTHANNSSVIIRGTDAQGAEVSFSQPVVAGDWFAGSGSATISGNTELEVTGGAFTGALVGGAYMAADSTSAASFTMNNATLTLNSGTFEGDIIGGSFVSAGSGVATQRTGAVSITVNGGTVSGTIYGGSYSMRNNEQSIATHGDISINLAGGSISGNVYAGGGLASGVSSSVTASSTQVEVSENVTLGAEGAPITISGGVENASAMNSISGNRTLLLSGASAYSNLGNATFTDFNVVNNAANASIMFQASDASLTKQGAGELTILAEGSNLEKLSTLDVAEGVLSTGNGLLSHGLSAITLAQGASLLADGLSLADAATLTLNVAGAPATGLISVAGEGQLSVAGGLNLSLAGFDSLSAGDSLTLMSWNNESSPFELGSVSWAEQAANEDYVLNIVDKSLVLHRLGTNEWVWDGSSETWTNDSGDHWQGNGASTGEPSGKDLTFNSPTTEESTVTISGAVTPQSVTVDNAEGSTYIFASDGTGDISGAATLTKENGGTLKVELSNSYTGGTTVNGGTLDAAAANALGTGAVTINAGGTLLSSVAGSVQGNALVLNGGTLSYGADETRDLGTAGITHGADVVPAVSVAAGSTVTWQYADAAALEAAMAEGISLSGGGTLRTEGTSAASNAALTGPISLTGENTTLELGATGAKQLGTEAAPMAISLAEGTTLRVERPDADAASTIHSSLTGNGTLEFTEANANATGTVQLSGDNSAFAGSINLGSLVPTPIALAADSPAVLLDYSQGSPVGGAESTLNLNGVGFAIVQTNGSTTATESKLNLNASTTQYTQSAGLENTFSGALTGAVGMVWTLDSTGADGGQTNMLTGDLSAFDGTLSATGKEGSFARWQLGGDGAQENPELALELTSTNAFNEFVIAYATETTLSGAVTGQANLTQQGEGTLVLTGVSTSSGTLSIAEGSMVQLGTAETAAQWGNATDGSSLAGAGTLTLVNGSLNGTLSLAAGAAPIVNVDVAAGKSVSLGGNEGSLITGSITLAAGATLTQVGTSILDKELNLTLDVGNIGTRDALGTAMVQFVDTPTLRAARAVTASLGSTTEDITLDISMAGVLDLLRRHRVEGTESYLSLTNGQLVTADDYSNVIFANNMDILDELGLRISGLESGAVVLSGTAVGVYVAGEGADPTEVTGYQNLGAYQAVAVMPGETLTLTLPGAPDAAQDGAGATLNNLLGAEDSALVINNTDTTGATGGPAVVILNNASQTIAPTPGDLPGDPAGANTSFGGSISQQGGEVELVKTGAGTLSVGGPVTVHQLTAQEGMIALNATGNELDTLSLDGGTVQLNGAQTKAETLENTANGGNIALAGGATLTTSGTSRLTAGQIGGAAAAGTRAAGAGTLQVTGELTLAEDARLDGVALDLAGGTLGLEGTSGHAVSALRGNGRINGTGTAETVGLSVTGTGGSFAGSLAGNGTLTIAEGAQQEFSNAFTGNSGWKLVNNGRMGLDLVQRNGRNGTLTLGDVSLGARSTTDVRVNTDAPTRNLLRLNSLTMAQGAKVNLRASAGAKNIVLADRSYIIGKAAGQAAGRIGNITPDKSNSVFMLLDARRSTLSVDGNGNLVLNLVLSDRNPLASMANNSNSATGAELLWRAAAAGRATPGTDIRRLLDALNSGQAGDTNRTLAAAAGAGIPVLSSAFASDVERQLRAIRNRTTGLPSPRRVVCNKGNLAPDAPRYGVWINGEGDHRRMNADGYLSGYSLSSWGGTVGVDMSCNECLTAGLALSALYGDLDAHSADNASGDFNRYYVTAFARMSDRRWQHTLMGTVGRLDADLDRSVYYGTGSYRTHGSTKGWGYGFMYEIGYTIPMDEEGNFTLQPIANVTWRNINVDGYTENGRDAALRVGDQDYNVVTFGAGLRTQARVGEGFLWRQALLEARALVKVDAGDRQGAATVAMLGNRDRWGKVHSEKLSAVGVELGAGITIPVGDEGGAFFIDGSAELRNAYSNLNGAVGYRFEF